MTDGNERFSLKDALFNVPKVRQLAGEVGAVYPDFDQDVFVARSLGRFRELERRARIAWLTDCLAEQLPSKYLDAPDVIIQALPPELDPSRTDDDFGDFIHAPYGDFVARFGCTAEHLDASLLALHEITRRFTAESAIRLFLNALPDQTFSTLHTWTEDPNYHVRRLWSEGTRPTLLWNMRLTIPYTAPIPLLDRLFADPTRHVTRSVTDHMNDVAKLAAELAVERIRAWKKEERQSPAEIQYMTSHALRTLIKQGHPAGIGVGRSFARFANHPARICAES